MKIKTHILVLFAMTLVFSTSALACGSSCDKSEVENKSKIHHETHSEKKSCCSSENEQEQDCGGNCSDSSCHCSTTVYIPILLFDFDWTRTDNFMQMDREWAYVRHLPQAVYRSIWQPPKIS